MSGAPAPQSLVASLRDTLSRVRLTLEEAGDSWVIGYERERHAVPRLPLEGISDELLPAELMAVAAGLEAAIKYPGGVETSEFVVGAANVLPKVERARFVDAYRCVLEGRDAGPGELPLHRDLGCGLIVVYVRDEGWRFHHVTEAQRAHWDVSPGTIDAAARSHLYHRAELDHRATTVALGDGYDGSRALIVGDVFYHLGKPGEGIPVAVASRDALLVGPAATAAAAREAFDGAAYPLHPEPLLVSGGMLRAGTLPAGMPNADT